MRGPRVRDGLPTSGPGRLEAFSDAVLAIVLTLLVLDLLPEDGAVPPSALLGLWPTYLAYVTAFLTVASIWLNHHGTFTRMRQVDPVVLLLNLGVLLGASLVPWPTSLLSAALQEGSRGEATAAIAVYAVVSILVGAPWAAMGAYVARHPDLLADPADTGWMRRHAWSSASTVLVALLGVLVGLVSPVAALLLFLVVPAVFVLRSTARPRPVAD